MADNNNTVTPLYNKGTLRGMITSIATLNPGKIIFLEHVEESMEKRNISNTEVIGVLKHGNIVTNVDGRNKGERKLRMNCNILGRDIDVVLVIDPPSKLLIVTTLERGIPDGE